MKLILSALVFTVLTFSACAEKITLYAAASTTNAVTEILEIFNRQTEHEAAASFASSGTLAKQIQQGAPADIFLSANESWMSWLEKQNLLSPIKADLLGNRLAVVTNINNAETPEMTRQSLLKAFTDNRFAAADPAHSPAGRYTRKALQSLGIWNTVQAGMAAMQTVRAALALAERGAVKYAVVYTSDASSSDKVRTAGIFDESLHGEISYPAAIVSGKDSGAAVSFFEFLKSDEAAFIFKNHGFTVR